MRKVELKAFVCRGLVANEAFKLTLGLSSVKLVEELEKRVFLFTKGLSAGLAVVLLNLTAPGCAVRRTTRVEPSLVPPPPQEASTADLISRVNSWSENIRTLTAKVDLEPTAGSVYSGVIKEYHDVRGFILFEKPSMIRMIGQAPIVRTQIFDMASDGTEFRVYVAPKEKFIVGKATANRPARNSLENLRPQHILEALLVPQIDPAHEHPLPTEEEEGSRRFYVVTVLDSTPEGEWRIERKVWFDRSDLEITRQQIYGARGSYNEDVRYSDYHDFQGVRYPTRIRISRPIEDYRLAITILEATFNQPIEPEKFDLKKPEKAQLVELTAASRAEDSRGE